MENLGIMLFGLFIGIIGCIGKPSNLEDPVNTATLVVLFGMLVMVLGFLK